MINREIALIDMDCFYAQVEQREKPELWGKPVIVVQHTRAGVQGGILAVSYEARKFGVKRGMPVVDAKKKCPELHVAHVPIGEHADKADIQKYRDASAEVFEVLNNFDSRIVVEKASVDEAFLDMTAFIDGQEDSELDLPTTHIADGEDVGDYDRSIKTSDWLETCAKDDEIQKRLAIAAHTVEQIRRKITETTQFYCSAGIANNKMLAKLVCARHKPRQQTIMIPNGIPIVLKTTKIDDVRGFGGKMGSRIQEVLGISMMGQLLHVDEDLLTSAFPEHGEWLKRVATGWDDEPVRPRSESSSIAVSKNFPGKNAIRTEPELKSWVEGLTKELMKRIVSDQAQNKRYAENLVFLLVTEDGKIQKTLKFVEYHPEKVLDQLWKAMKPLIKTDKDENLVGKVFHVHLNASRFVQGLPPKTKKISEWLSAKSEEDLEVVEDLRELPETAGKELELTSCSPAKASSSKENEFMEINGEKISKKVFEELPDFIRKEYEHHQAIERARKMKSDMKPVQKTGKKRPATRKEVKVKQAKTLDKFFK